MKKSRKLSGTFRTASFYKSYQAAEMYDKMTKSDALNEIYELLSDNFEQFGYISNKKRNTYTQKEGVFTFNIEIYITSKLRQHITLSVEHKEIEKIFHSTLEESGGSRPAKKVPVCNLTDWKQLYTVNNMPIGEIWFKSFSNIEEIKKYKDAYVLAITLATQWFDKCMDLDYVYNYNLNVCFTTSIEIALCIGKFLGKDIEKEYRIFSMEKDKKSGWDKNQVNIFLKHLLSFPRLA
jgi:hypothetical protein